MHTNKKASVPIVYTSDHSSNLGRGGIVVQQVVLLRNPQFDPELRFLSVWSFLPPIKKNIPVDDSGYDKLPLNVDWCVCVHGALG